MHAASCVRPLRKEGRRSVCGLHAASQMQQVQQQVRTSGAACLEAGAVGMPMKRRFSSAMLSSRWMSLARRPSGSAPAGCRSKRSGLLCLAQGPMRQQVRTSGAAGPYGNGSMVDWKAVRGRESAGLQFEDGGYSPFFGEKSDADVKIRLFREFRTYVLLAVQRNYLIRGVLFVVIPTF